MKRREFLQTSAALGMAALMPGAASFGEGNESRPNVFWIILDDVRNDAFGCYGTPWAHTPTIDRIAEQGVRFEHAFVQCPICIPSRTSFKTGHYCHELPTRENAPTPYQYPMSMGEPPEEEPAYIAAGGERPSLLRAWTDAGMKPINAGKLHALHDEWDRRADPRQPRDNARPGGEGERYDPVRLTTYGWRIGGTHDVHVEDTAEALLTEEALGICRELAERNAPFFFRVSFRPPHVPIQVPPEFMLDLDAVDLPWPKEEALESKPRFEREQLCIYSGTLDLSERDIRVARSTYYGMVNMVDYFVGRIMEEMNALGLLDNTIVAVTGEHGLAMGENGLHKKRSFYDPVVHSPLIYSWPGRLPEGKVINDQVEMIDFMPTLLDLSELPAPDGIPGRSLVPLINGEDRGREVVFSEIDHSGSMYDPLRENSGRQVMARTDKWKLVYFHDPRVDDKDGALYNLEEDLWEFHNLYHDPEYRDIVEMLEEHVRNWDRAADGGQ